MEAGTNPFMLLPPCTQGIEQVYVILPSTDEVHFLISFSRKASKKKLKCYRPKNLAFHFEFSVMLKDFLALREACAHTCMLTH